MILARADGRHEVVRRARSRQSDGIPPVDGRLRIRPLCELCHDSLLDAPERRKGGVRLRGPSVADAAVELCRTWFQGQVGGESIAGGPAVGSKMSRRRSSAESIQSRKAHLLKGTRKSCFITGSVNRVGNVGGANVRTEQCSSISKQPLKGVSGHVARGSCRTILERRGVVEGRGVVGACRASSSLGSRDLASSTRESTH